MRHRHAAALLLLASAASCAPVEKPDAPVPLAPVRPGTPFAAPQTDAALGSLHGIARAHVSYGTGAGVQGPQAQYSAGSTGDISLDFADTDVREAAAQILGTMLHANYTIDPGVHGTVTLHTSQPIGRDQLVPTLEVLLSQVSATLVQTGGLYRVQALQPGPGGAASSFGGTIVPLHAASAEQLAKVLQPYAGNGARITADPASNALVVSADPTQRGAIVDMIHAFDIDALAGQSFALLPVDSGDAKDFATALEKVLAADQGKGLANLVRVVPMGRIDAVLVVTPDNRMMGDVRRIYGLVLDQRRQTVRAWHVYYLQNGRSNDVAYVLQQAFTPDHVTAQPTQQNQLQQLGSTGSNSGSGGGLGGGGSTGTSGGLGTSTGVSGGIGGIAGQTGGQGGAGTQGQGGAGGANPLLGGLEGGGTGEGGATKDEMKIIPADQQNAVLIYGTPQELETVENTLHKIDIVPMQVRIDATVAEVDLDNALEYGTQFFFKQAGSTTSAIGSSVTAGASGATGGGGQLSPAFTAVGNALTGGGFEGFLLAGGNAQQAALDLLQSVSKVRVLSSPELVVLDNQPARLQVGQDVPVLSEQQQSTVTANSSIVNSVSYVQTGVMLQITPRVNNDGQVTLDIAEEVSSSLGITTTTGSTSSSPTFQDRNVQTRVVVQDGQTVGVGGLIQDTDSRQNQGVPYLRNIPVIGSLFGQQANTRSRTELLIMITPHVERDAHDARAVTADMEAQMPFAAGVPSALQGMKQEGLSDPQAHVLHGLGLSP